MRELQAGRDVLQVPYSDAAAGTAVKHLKAAAGRPHLRSADTFLGAHALDMGTALGLLNQYLQWFLSGAPASQPDSMPASQYRQWFLSGAPATTSQYSSSTGTSTTCSRALLDGLTECLTLIYSICTALALADTRGVAAGLRSHLVAADTGELLLAYQIVSVLGQCQYLCLCLYLHLSHSTAGIRCSYRSSPEQHDVVLDRCSISSDGVRSMTP
jgi:hypothetical protein